MIHRQLSCLVAGPIFLTCALASAADPAPVEPKEPKADVAATEPKKDAVPSTSRWQTSFYGFIEFDAMYDTTQSFSDSPVNGPLLRSDASLPAYLPVGTEIIKEPMYGSTHGRLQATARNTRFGFKMTPPEFAGIKATGVLEVDLFGNQPSSPPVTPEASFFTNAALRLRHAYVKLEAGIDVTFGQYYNLFGWQPNFFPATLSFLGTPNMIFGRTPQLRIGKLIKTDPVNVEIAAAATRPPQRDSGIPGLEGGVRFEVNRWRGAHGRGSGQPTLDGLSFGVSGVLRKFRVTNILNNRGDFTAATDAAHAFGYGYSLDAFVPVIPAHDLENRAWSLALTGSWVKGQGIADLYTGGLTGNIQFPLPEGPGGRFNGFYASNIDPGLVQYRLLPPGAGNCGAANCGELRVLRWQSAMVGFQLYLPPAGRLVLTGNYSRAKSDNAALTDDVMEQINQGGDPARTFNSAQYFDANIFVDVTPAIRGAVSYQLIKQKFLNAIESPNGGNEKNHRVEVGGLFFF